MREVRKWRCGFCKKDYYNKSYCKNHEDKCYHNPKNKACISCAYNEKTYIEVPENPYYAGAISYKEFDGQYCAKYQRWVYKMDTKERNLEIDCKGWKDLG